MPPCLRPPPAFLILLALLLGQVAAAPAQDRLVTSGEILQKLGDRPDESPVAAGLRLRGPAGVRAAAADAGPQEIAVHIRFGFGSAALADEFSRRQLEQAAEALASPVLKGLAVEIGGHTDAVGAQAYNLELSRLRAEAVREALCRRPGVDCARLSVVGYGMDRPVAPNDTEEGRALNRRVVFRRLP